MKRYLGFSFIARSSGRSAWPRTKSFHKTAREFSHDSKDAKIALVKKLPVPFLLSLDSKHYDSLTHQRLDIEFDKNCGKMRNRSTTENHQIHRHDVISIRDVLLNRDSQTYQINWSDGTHSIYAVQTISEALMRQNYDPSVNQVLWTGYTEDTVRQSTEISISFNDLLEDSGMEASIQALYKYGILLVTQTPVNDGGEAVAALGAALSGGSRKNETSLVSHYKDGRKSLVLSHGTDGPLRTLYGTVWSTTTAGQAGGASVADSSYGHEALPLHTDMTYMRDPPGLQIFTMKQPAVSGGESVFGDGFAAAELLKIEDPEAYRILSSVVRRYRSIDDETGWHLEAEAPIITLRNDHVVAIRHNDLDRLPDLPSSPNFSSENEFYSSLRMAHEKWDRILSSDEVRLVMKLKVGDTMVVANQRCFHGRYSFESSPSNPRSVSGCYVSQDDLCSRFRRLGLFHA